jgi:membrane glycosyltransferase
MPLFWEALARRTAIFGATAASTAIAAHELYEVLRVSGLTWVEKGLIALFVINFVWVALSFWASLAGVFVLRWRLGTPGLARPMPDAPLTGRTAVLVPVYNEDPAGVYANLEAIYRSLAATGQLDAFDFFILSDSTDPDVWIAEEAGWAALCRRLGGQGRIFYRKRRRNTGRKAGNVADFCRRWGRRYETMVVLDADSVMDGGTLVAMARLMALNPDVGLIQSPPVIIGRHTLFARLHQFASRLYGPVFAAGQAFWQLGDGNFWGHNAIIRTRAFMDACGLPELPGRAPFGGHILSHDFVEAALLRRAGWRVWLLPELGGSYEETPPTLLDFAKRDRRWCQGNLQHLRVLVARGLHPISRLHLAMGIMSYLSSPLWLVFLTCGLLMAVHAQVFAPPYFMGHETLFPVWPTLDVARAAALFGVTMGMLAVPKLLGLALVLADRRAARGFGGRARAAAAMGMEMVFSALVAPVMMLFHSRFVVDILRGRDAGWMKQRRDGGRVTVGEAAARHAGHTLFGAALGATAWAVSPVLFWWLSPLVAGLILAVPLNLLSARAGAGAWARRRRLFAIPEEADPPLVLYRAETLAETYRTLVPAGADGLSLVVTDPLVHAVHLSLLPGHSDAAAGDPDTLAAARDRLAAAGYAPEAAGLSPAEATAVLFDADLLTELRHARLAAAA